MGAGNRHTANVNVNFAVWHTTKMFGGTCAPTYHPQLCIMSTGHVFFTSLLTLHTPFCSIMQITITITKVCQTKVCHCEMVFIKRYILSIHERVAHETSP